MRNNSRLNIGRHHGYFLLLGALAVTFSSYFGQVMGMPSDLNQWPTFPRRNIAALARDGYLKHSMPGYKRSISTLAKNGQLPTFRSPYDETDKQEQDDDESHEKRNVASIARLRSYAAMKRNIQALARDGYRAGRGQYNQPNDKRNLASLARNGMIHKKDEIGGDEYYFPFYQNPIPPLSEIDGPFDFNEMYDFQQSINPDMMPPLSQVFKKSDPAWALQLEPSAADMENNLNFKRGIIGMPVHGLYRSVFIEPSEGSVRNKRYILSLPDVLDHNDINVPENTENTNDDDKRSVDEDNDVRENFEKRHIGSLARLGLLPSFRFSGGRYSRSGRARLLLPSQELYRKHSSDENFGIRKYIPGAEIDVDPDDADVSSSAVSSYSHPTGRLLHRPLNNDLPTVSSPPLPPAPYPRPNFIDALTKNSWQSNKEVPKFYHFRSLKVPYHTSGKRYLLLPAVDNILLRKTYRNSSLPSRRKNQ
ncbi:neuropeptide-like precursor 1 [Amyelois transitella]|uniref:neuropeptide-like precursor 1 n=1 Tax=Amyelois transitella TaxID=680683 RepID=UPI00298F7C75|nr:neuropeptide-like precursor 1 [Amyelois transitella]